MDISEDKRKLIIKFALNNKDVTALKFINEDPMGIHIKEMSGGIVNYVYRVTSGDKKHSVILKHAEEEVKAIDMANLPLGRQVTEYECLKLFDSIVPGCVPEPYCLDQENNILAMEDLSDRELLGDYLISKGPNVQLASEWGRVLAKLHQATMKENVSPEYWQEVKSRIVGSRHLLRTLICERYYGESVTVAKLPQAALDNYQQFVREAIGTGLQKKLLELFDDEQCLLQVDCHWNSVFVKDNSVAMFDFDLATLTHPGIALAYIAAAFVVCFVMSLNDGCHLDERNILNSEGRKKKLKFKEALQCLLVKYVEERDMTGKALSSFISDTALFTGNLLIVTSLFENMEAFDPRLTVLNQATFCQLGINVMRTHRDILAVNQLGKAAFDIDTFY